MNISQQSIESYVNDVISSKPVPGGGSVSALIGSHGAALAGMLVALTTGKKAFQAFAPADQRLFGELANFFALQKDRLLQLASEDIDAYEGFLTALRLPKDTPEERAVRDTRMQAAQLHATEVPLETARTAFEALENIGPVVEKGNANAISDAAVGAMCLNLAVQGGIYNARINLPGLADESLRAEVAAECRSLQAKSEALLRDVLAAVDTRLG